MKAKTTKAKVKPAKRYLVVPERIGHYKEGIHYVDAYVVNDKAIVLRGATQADVFPKNLLFETREKAQVYFAGKGKLMWVVDTNDRKGGTDVFQAWVKEAYGWDGYKSRREWARIIVRCGSKKPETDRYSMRTKVFETKAEAVKYALPLIRDDLRRASREIKQWDDLAIRMTQLRIKLREKNDGKGTTA